jgi:hypothetical protein
MIQARLKSQVRVNPLKVLHPVRLGSALTPAEIRTYYRAVLGPERVSDRQAILIFYWCPFKPHTDGFTVNLVTGRWCCQGGCGEGDLYAFEMKRSQADHFRRSKERVFEIISRAQDTGHDNRIAETDARWLVAKIDKRPGSTRRYLQQVCHWPASRFNRAIERAEQQKLVDWKDQPLTAGQVQRTYYPGSSSQANSGSGNHQDS